jgi:hypothetical protein
MNGRIYDPLLGQFMQADNFIQSPEDFIDHNRYAYCRNNPFKYVDPSGERRLVWRDSNFLYEVPANTQGAISQWEDDNNTMLDEELGRLEAWMNKPEYIRAPQATIPGLPSGGGGGGGCNYGSSQQNKVNNDLTPKIPDPIRDTERDMNPSRAIGDKTPIFKNGFFIDNPDAYNCHSYAWHNGLGDPTQDINKLPPVNKYPKWDEDPMDDAKEMADPLTFSQTVQIGDRIIYFDNNGKPTHSAIVTEVNELGLATRCTSKWGAGYLMDHHPRDVPDAYGTNRKYYRMKNKGIIK